MHDRSPPLIQPLPRPRQYFVPMRVLHVSLVQMLVVPVFLLWSRSRVRRSEV